MKLIHFRPKKVVPLKKGDIPPHFPGARFSGTYSPWDLGAVIGGRLTHEATVSVNTTAPRLLEKWSGRVQLLLRGWLVVRIGVWTHKYLFEKALIKRVQNTNPHEVFFLGFWKTREKDVFLVDIAFAFF